MNGSMKHHDLKTNLNLQRNLLGLPKLCHRNQLPALLNAMGVEVGVQAGEFSRLLREQWQGDVLYLIDCWRYDPSYQDKVNVPQEKQEQLYQEVQAMFSKHPGVRVLREESLLAAPRFQEEWLDWVYLDADYSQAAVAQDLVAWWPRIKSGGILSGHDYCDGIHHNANFGVKSAVDAFALEHGLKILTTAEAHFPSWYCLKP